MRSYCKAINSVNPQKFPAILKQMLHQKLLTLELFAALFLIAEGNTLCFLARSGEFALLNQLIDADLVTDSTLVTKEKELNAVWFLAKSLQFIMLGKLLEKGMLSNELLRATPDSGEFKGINAVWFLVRARQYTLLEKIVHADKAADLFTPNTLQLLLQDGNYDFLALLFQKGVVTKEFMATNLQPVVLCWKTISDLIKAEHFALAELLFDKNSISWRRPTYSETQNNQSMLSPTEIDLLQAKKQENLFKKLVEKGIANECPTPVASSITGKEHIVFFSKKSAVEPIFNQPQQSLFM
ncbi:MAG: hypothetical protein ACRCXC_05610 [Legionella sp.]